jgi:hypothetical protein
MSLIIPIEPTSIDKIKQYLLHWSNIKKPLTISLSLEVKRPVDKHLNRQFDEIKQQILLVEEMYSAEMKRIGNIVVLIRSGKLQQERIFKMFIDDPKEKLQKQIRVTSDNLDGLIGKAQLIHNFHQRNIEYSNIQQLSIEGNEDYNVLVQNLLINTEEKLIFCCNDDLRRQDSSKWHNDCERWINARETNSQLHLVYADFSYCSFELPQIEILSSNDMKEKHKKSSSTVNFINVLLLCESGVGKSTPSRTDVPMSP